MQSWQYCCAAFSNAQILGDNLPLSVFSYSWLAIIRIVKRRIVTNHQPYPLEVDLSPACGRTLAPGIIFLLFVLLFESLVQFQINICLTWHYLDTLTDGFQASVMFPKWTNNCWITCCLMFIIRFLVLVSDRPENRGVVNKRIWKKKKRISALLQWYSPKISC